MSRITVGDIISNPAFDVNANIAIQEPRDDADDVYVFQGWPDDCPSELLILPVSYITVRNDALVIEYEDREE